MDPTYFFLTLGLGFMGGLALGGAVVLYLNNRISNKKQQEFSEALTESTATTSKPT